VGHRLAPRQESTIFTRKTLALVVDEQPPESDEATGTDVETVDSDDEATDDDEDDDDPGSSVNPTDPEPPSTTDGDLQEFPTYADLTESFEGSISGSVFTHVAVKGYKWSSDKAGALASSGRLALVEDAVHENTGIEVQARPGDGVADLDSSDGRDRAEIVSLKKEFSQPGRDTVYGFSIKPLALPAPKTYTYITQFLSDHDTPRAHNNPTHGIFLSSNGKIRLWSKPQVSGAQGVWEEVEAMPNDQWTHWELRIKWRTDATSECNFYRNGALVHAWKGQNLAAGNEYTQWKIGFYRGHYNDFTSKGVYDRAFIGTAFP
jgi:hypothetical protein